MERLRTKVTYLGKGLYGCRVIDDIKDEVIVETRVVKSEIRHAIFDMLRTLSKGGVDSKMADASRKRGKARCTNAKYIWR